MHTIMPKMIQNMPPLNVEYGIKVWYPEGVLAKSYGYITDYYRDYVEVYDPEKRTYVIIHWTLIDFI